MGCPVGYFVVGCFVGLFVGCRGLFVGGTVGGGMMPGATPEKEKLVLKVIFLK